MEGPTGRPPGGAVLGIDTATPDTAVAAVRAGELVAERLAGPGSGGRPRHATALLPAVEATVGEAGGWPAIGSIAVGVGPGTFTGLRIGIATARALAQSRSLPIAGVGSLAALARGIGERPDARGRPRLAAIDAKRGELFAALQGPDEAMILEPFVVAPDGLGPWLGGLEAPPLAAGDGSLRFRSDLEAAGVEVLPEGEPEHRMAARHVCALAGMVEPGRPEAIEPIYLRRPDAELWRERDRSRGADGA